MKRICLIFFFSILIFGCRKSTGSGRVARSALNTDTLELTSKIKVTSAEEPGEMMIISGTIFLPDGKTPAMAAILSVWQTDAKGYYIEGGGGAGELHPRLHGRLKTSTDGVYEFQSVKPGQYPSHTTPAHVHAHISAPNFPEYALIFYFEGDDLINDKNRAKLNSNRGGTPSIIVLTKNEKGVWVGHRDIILEYVKPSSETLKLQW
jgi:protocatechuate 3,4-dioxygenase beta subunit